jgi:ubiquinone/menaquinone biosynthesis C-methylase UbiE
MQTRDAQVRELLDSAALDDEGLRRNLADIRHINAWLGWTAFAVREVMRFVAAAGLERFALLDVASGSADIPLAVARAAERRSIPARIVVTDLSQQVVAVARERAASYPNVMAEQRDALALPYATASFDIALCTLALHHFDPPDAVTLLRGLRRVGRHVLVFDVERSPLAYVGAWMLTRVARMSYMTRHDAPVSVRRAYSAYEMRELAAQAGLHDARVRIGLPFRLALEASGAG